MEFDMSAAKSLALDETRHFEFRAEMFNLPNHPNFNAPSGFTAFTGVNTATGAPTISPTWGVISTTVTTSRQIQFGLKFVF
jgi:hypothetical protein